MSLPECMECGAVACMLQKHGVSMENATEKPVKTIHLGLSLGRGKMELTGGDKTAKMR